MHALNARKTWTQVKFAVNYSVKKYVQLSQMEGRDLFPFTASNSMFPSRLNHSSKIAGLYLKEHTHTDTCTCTGREMNIEEMWKMENSTFAQNDVNLCSSHTINTNVRTELV